MASTSDSARSAARRLVREFGPLLVMVVLLVLARSTFANHYHVPSGSMEPALRPGDRVLVDMSAYGLRAPFTRHVLVPRDRPAPGEVVVFRSPADGTRLIKRVVAVGGQDVALVGGKLWIDGRPLAAPGPNGAAERHGARTVRLDLSDGGGPDIPPQRIPPGMVLVLGDHRGDSADGRWFGLVPEEAFYGRAIAVYWRRGEGPAWERL